VQLTDPKGKMHTITLAAGKQFHTHKGILEHDSLIDGPEGVVVTLGSTSYLALRPLLADFVLSMPRGAQVVYPKDAGPDRADGGRLPRRPRRRGRCRVGCAVHVAAARGR
jgi:tRNA (adenine57-N1/adenine58-N1)-methyltransferase